MEHFGKEVPHERNTSFVWHGIAVARRFSPDNTAAVKLYLARRLNSIHELLFEVERCGEGQSWNNDKLYPARIKPMLAALTSLSEELSFLGLSLTKTAVDRFFDRVDASVFINSVLDDMRSEDVVKFLEQTRERFSDELANVSFFYVDSQRIKNYDRPIDADVIRKFPSSEYDLIEAGNCLALDRFTAAVVHSMRALEPGLSALGDALGVTRGSTGWGRDLNNFNTKWVPMANNPPSHWMRTLVPAALAEFRYFADAWRNRSVHAPRARYGEDEATRVVEHVRDFLKLLSAELSEPTTPS